jgi:ribonuclease-3 family protein
MIPGNLSPEALHTRALAHLGDAVYELHVRMLALQACADQAEQLHKFSIERASASFQAALLAQLDPHLTEAERDLVRRARNAPLSSARRSQQATHRLASGFEALIGYLYLTAPDRLATLWILLEPALASGAISSPPST